MSEADGGAARKRQGLELRTEAVRFAYPGPPGSRPALGGVSVTVAPGEFVGLVGPNGSGKTTLLRLLTGLLKPQGGTVLLDGREVSDWRPAQLAASLGVVGQGEEDGFAFTVAQVVAMGRYPRRKRWQPETAADRRAVETALQLTGLTALRDRPVTALSGGERQRVVLARALAQEPRTLLLDEVTAHLDLAYQAEVFALLQRLHAERGLTVVAVLHDLNRAARACQRLILLAGGRVIADGPPAAVLTAENLRTAYGLEVNVETGRDGHPLVTVEGVAGWTGAGAGTAVAPHFGGDASGRSAITPAPAGPVHVICGGGSGTWLLAKLAEAGCQLSCGVLNRGDSDWEAARLYGAAVVEEAPFSAVSPEAHARNLALIRRAAAVVVADVPFGPGNLPNLRAAREAREMGRPVFACAFTPLAERDYTGGEAAREFGRLLADGATLVRDPEEVLPALAALVPQQKKEENDDD